MMASVSVYRDGIKPLLDRVGAALLLVLLAPAFLLIAVAVRVGMGSPVLFTQTRIGKSGREFQLFKFRTMTDATDELGRPLTDGARLTRVGKWLRSTSLDELPELWNVLRGEMSLVGPRPLLVEYLAFYSPWQARRHEVKPGLTGLAQVGGRNLLSWEEKFELDVHYVDRVSLPMDLAVLCKTIACVYRRIGVNTAADGAMPRFAGSNQESDSSAASTS